MPLAKKNHTNERRDKFAATDIPQRAENLTKRGDCGGR
jgi:hypothetical protein